MRLRPRTLLWQLGLALMVMQSVLAVVLGAWAFIKLKQFHQQETTRQLDRLAALVAGRVEPLLATSPPSSADLRRLAELLGESAGARVTILLEDGRVVGDSDHDPAVMDDHRFRPEIDEALRTGSGAAIRFSTTLGTDMMYVARPVPQRGPPLGVVRVAMPLSAVNAPLGRLVRLLGLAGIISLGLTFGVIYVVSRNLSRTVLGLARGTLRFASGDLQHRIRKPASNELATVTEAFNRMAGQLESQITALRARQNEQQAILQSMRNGVLALDAEQRVLTVNRAAERALGIDAASARGRLLQEAVREPELHRVVADAMSGAGRQAHELTVGHGQRVLEALAEPLTDGDGEAVGLVVVLNDVTQLRRLESIRSDFAANVSHELQTPITAIKGYVETLLDAEPAPSQETQRFLEIINRNAERLAAIIEDLLALARLEEPDAAQALERVPTPVAPLLGSVASQLETAAAEKGIMLAVQAPAALSAPLSPRLIEQAVANLVSNAVKFGPRDSTVTLQAGTSNGRLEITVADEGPGIPPEHLPRLFERFYRVDRARSRALGGTGLGLAIVKHIAAVHGGQAEVESTVGAGSVFRIIVPLGSPGDTRGSGNPD